MLWTMKQAERQLLQYARRGPDRVRDDILDAVEALSASKYWDRQRQVVRFTTLGGGRFALPQEFESIVRVAVDGTPVLLRGTEFNFSFGGPGDLDALPAGYAPGYGVVDEGFHPPFTVSRAADTVLAVSMSAASADHYARVFFNSGSVLDLRVNASADVDAATAWTDLTYTGTAPTTYGDVAKVVLKGDNWPQGWVNLWAGAAGAVPSECGQGRVHSCMRVPQFRFYHIPGVDQEHTYNVLAEVRPAKLRLTGDDDVLPFPSLLPVQYMMQAQAKFDAEEQQAGKGFRDLAIGTMAQIDESESRMQTVIRFNTELQGGNEPYYENI